jgi:transcriptional regulator GlxA family with amidase domain
MRASAPLWFGLYGALVLAEAGLLDGRRATTHWNWSGDLARNYPRVTVDADPIYIKDGNCYTSAGVTSGIDLSLALVEEDFGTALSLQIAQMMVFLRRPGGQSQFSATLAAQSSESPLLNNLPAWMEDNLRLCRHPTEALLFTPAPILGPRFPLSP